MTTTEIGFGNKKEQALALVDKCAAMTVKSAEDHATAEEYLKTVREFEKELEEQYKTHPVIVEANALQKLKGELAQALESARKGLKNGPMLDYERGEESKRKAEEERITAELRRQAEEEAREAAAKAKAAADLLAEIERKKAEAARAEAARAKAKGDAEAVRIAQEKQAAAKA